MWEVQPKGMQEALRMHNKVIRTVLKKHRGYECKTEGDAFMVAFGNTASAVEWAVEVQHALLEIPWPSEVLETPFANIQR